MADVGLIGVGLVGSALAERFRQAGLSAIGYDPRLEGREALAAAGGMVAESARAVAEAAPVVVLSLPDSDAVEAVVRDIEPVLAGRTVVDTTTGDPDRTATLGERLKSVGVDYLDATIVGSSRLVREGMAVVVAGGEADVFRRCADLLDSFATREFHVGPWGSGARMKLVVNLVLGLNRAVLAEGLAFARASGFDPAVALEVLRSGVAHSRVMDAKGRKMIDGDFAPDARLGQHHKDVRLVLDASARAGIELPLSRLHDELLTELEGRGLGGLDNSAIIRAYESRAPREGDMQYRTLGRTGLRVSALAFGAGPVSGLMTGDDHAAQAATLRRAVERGINWIDTAAGYGQGASEANVGRALSEIGSSAGIHVATKVRLTPADLTDVRGAVRRSIEQSLQRLGRSAVTLLQLHNGLTPGRDDEPFSITPADVLGPGGVLEVFREVQAAGLARFVGLTGTGRPTAMWAVVRSGEFDTIQVPYHLLNQSAGYDMPADFDDTDYGNIIADSSVMEMGVFAIRVFAGGALLNQPPSAHTLKTPFFPLALYERERQRAQALAGGGSLKEEALRFVLDDPRVHSAIVGFGSPDQVDEACDLVERKTAGLRPGGAKE